MLLSLAEIENIVSFKDAEGDNTRAIELSAIMPNFNMLAGDDQNLIAYSACGGKGCVSVLANLLPKEMLAIQADLEQQNYAEARIKITKIWPLLQAINTAPNPAGIKYALSLLGLCELEYRLPMSMPDNAAALSIRASMENLAISS